MWANAFCRLGAVAILLPLSFLASARNIEAVCPQKMRPICYQEHGEMKGVIVDLYRDLSKRLGRPIIVKVAPPKRIILRLKDGNLDIATVLYAEKRTSFSRYVSTPILPLKMVLFGTKEHYFAYQKISDLDDKVIGVRRGYHFTDEYAKAVQENKFQVIQANSDDQLLALLEKGRVNYILTPEFVVASAGSRLSDAYIRYGYLSAERMIMLAVSKQSPFYLRFDEVDKAVAEMSADGTLEKLQKRYFSLLNL